MRLIKVGMVNHNPTVGAFDTNILRIGGLAKQLDPDCHLVVLPEGAVSGYPCEDLVLWPSFVQNQMSRFKSLADTLGRISPSTLYTFGGNVMADGHVYNVVVLAQGGELIGFVPKQFMADGNVFYDSRSLDRGAPRYVTAVEGVPFGDLLIQAPFGIIGASVCEDVWAAKGPVQRQAFAGAELLINQSASPFRTGIVNTREELLATRSAESQATLIYVNQFGGNDSLVFDGGSYIFQNGRCVHRAPRWQCGVSTAVIDLDRTSQARLESNTWRRESLEVLASEDQPEIIEIDGREPNNNLQYPVQDRKLVFVPSPRQATDARTEYFEDLLAAMETGLSDYMDKTGHFKRIGISSSGGKDSVLAAYVAWRVASKRFKDLPGAERTMAIKDFLWCISQPTHFNSDTTKSIARDFAADIGSTFVEESIEDAFGREVDAIKKISGLDVLPGNTEQNIQAGIRAQRMWRLANALNMLFVYTGNMSETSVGYTTIGGDLMGAYGPIRNLPKTVVTELIRYLAEKHGWQSLQTLLATPPSAELRADQTDEGDLMPYPILDSCFYYFAGQKVSADDLYQIIRSNWTNEQLCELYPGYERDMLRIWVDKFVKLFFGSIFKWVQSPLGVHLGSFDLDRERAMQIPVVQSTEWLRPN